MDEKARALIEKLRQAGYFVEVSLASEDSIKAAHKIYFTREYAKREEMQTEIAEEDLGPVAEEIAGL